MKCFTIRQIFNLSLKKSGSRFRLSIVLLLIIDNYDSFTHNLARYFVTLGQVVKVVRNDHITCEQIAELAPDYLVFSPGPCTPNESGVTLGAIEQFSGVIPMLGVCLGHQAIAQVFGANIIRARNIKHGKTSYVTHDNSGLFNAIPTPFIATRYHSLLVEEQGLPESLKVTAWCDEIPGEREIMAIEHRSLAVYGVQFHPESLLSTCGMQILANFLTVSADKIILA
ncbi:Aminodeoxychorismate/anthranilate synthase component 2 [Paraglaciecola mesophila]|uniref:Aminodeoxychorismate/anthranilate synthase component 2 n=1 Tax=Paraglaciecola mesophila TaxID=197222 RepID=A0A857JJC1_9ALTE|nr:Aminodeoxychorismate/anthranilate synthase component 2 [Paraglaciecola mesophila]